MTEESWILLVVAAIAAVPPTIAALAARSKAVESVKKTEEAKDEAAADAVAVKGQLGNIEVNVDGRLSRAMDRIDDLEKLLTKWTKQNGK